MQPRACRDSFRYQRDVATLLGHCAACHPCPYWPGALLDGSTFWLSPDLSPAVKVKKQVGEEQLGFDLQPRACGDSFGYGKDVATLLWHCTGSHPRPYWPGAPWKGSTFRLRLDLGPADTVAKRVAEEKARLRFAIQRLWRLIWVWKGWCNRIMV